MDLFPDGSHVRLRSRALGTYVHADEDGVGVSLSPRRASLNAAWVVHRATRDGVGFVLLHGAAYGRYLALSPDRAPLGHRGRRVVQADRDDFDSDPEAVLWRATRVVAWGGDDVLLRHDDVQRNLRANAWRRRWRTGVSVDEIAARRSTMTRWVVETVPPRAGPPELPLPVPTPNVGARHGLFRRRAKPPVELVRTIWYVRADDQGNVNELNWDTFQFTGRSVYDLRARVASLEKDMDASHFTLCVKGGNEARRTPLVVDLPLNQNAMTIIALTTGSPGAAALVYADVDAEAP